MQTATFRNLPVERHSYIDWVISFPAIARGDTKMPRRLFRGTVRKVAWKRGYPVVSVTCVRQFNERTSRWNTGQKSVIFDFYTLRARAMHPKVYAMPGKGVLFVIPISTTGMILPRTKRPPRIHSFK
jgi:hypothetical protein